MAIPTNFRNGLRVPAIASPMFIISNPDLVVAQCTSGVIGTFPSLNARPGPLLETWLQDISERLAAHNAAHPETPAAPFGVNLIVHRSNDRLDHDLALCVRYRVPLIITSLGARSDVNDAIHSYGGLVMHDVIHQDFARKAISKGADGLILVAAGAGGHAGGLSPFAFVQETRQWFDGPVALSGSIATGRAIRAAEILGADFAYIGSAFIATHEARASDAYKREIVSADASEIIYSSYFTGVLGNYLRQSIVAVGLDPDNLPASKPSIMDFGSGGGNAAKVWRDIWGCGQGIGAIDRVVSVASLVDRLAMEYRYALIMGGFQSEQGVNRGAQIVSV